MWENNIQFSEIGIIRTPYTDNAPYQPVDNDAGEFYVSLKDEYAEGLKELEKFSYIYLLYHVHRITRPKELIISPPWADGKRVGVFASRSPARPNPIGLSVVKLIKIEGNKIYTSGLDVFDNTPLLDIKPYLKELDSKCDANLGWVEEMEDAEHLALHIKGIPHDY